METRWNSTFHASKYMKNAKQLVQFSIFKHQRNTLEQWTILSHHLTVFMPFHATLELFAERMLTALKMICIAWMRFCKISENTMCDITSATDLTNNLIENLKQLIGAVES